MKGKWDHLIRHIRSEKAVQVIRGNLRLAQYKARDGEVREDTDETFCAMDFSLSQSSCPNASNKTEKIRNVKISERQLSKVWKICNVRSKNACRLFKIFDCNFQATKQSARSASSIVHFMKDCDDQNRKRKELEAQIEEKRRYDHLTQLFVHRCNKQRLEFENLQQSVSTMGDDGSMFHLSRDKRLYSDNAKDTIEDASQVRRMSVRHGVSGKVKVFCQTLAQSQCCPRAAKFLLE